MAKILLVEDDNNLREIYEARLQAEGYTIVVAKDGEEALVVAKQEHPDLIISDVMMPRVSGFEMLDILRNTEGFKDTKVIMLTALGQAEDQSRAGKLGADRYLVKSQVTLEDIVNAAIELLGGVGGMAPAAPTASAATDDGAAVTSAPTSTPTEPATPVTPEPPVSPTTPSEPTPPLTPIATPPTPSTPPEPVAPAIPVVAPPMTPEPATPIAAPAPVVSMAQPPVTPVTPPSAPVPEPTVAAPPAAVAPMPTPVVPTSPPPAAPAAMTPASVNVPSPVTPPAPVATPVAESATTKDDQLMADAMRNLLSAAQTDEPAPQPTTTSTPPMETPDNTVAPTTSTEPATNQSAAPVAPESTDADDAMEDSDAVTIARKKVIAPIDHPETAAAPDLNALLAREGIDGTINPSNTAMTPDGRVIPPHPPGHVIAPAPAAPPVQPAMQAIPAPGTPPVAPPPAPGATIDPSSISL